MGHHRNIPYLKTRWRHNQQGRVKRGQNPSTRSGEVFLGDGPVGVNLSHHCLQGIPLLVDPVVLLKDQLINNPSLPPWSERHPDKLVLFPANYHVLGYLPGKEAYLNFLTDVRHLHLNSLKLLKFLNQPKFLEVNEINDLREAT